MRWRSRVLLCKLCVRIALALHRNMMQHGVQEMLEFKREEDTLLCRLFWELGDGKAVGGRGD